MTLHEYQDALTRIEQMYDAKVIDYDEYKRMVQELYDEVY